MVAINLPCKVSFDSNVSACDMLKITPQNQNTPPPPRPFVQIISELEFESVCLSAHYSPFYWQLPRNLLGKASL